MLHQTNQRKPKIKHEETRRVSTTSNKHTQNQTKVPTKHNNLEELSDVDFVSPNVKSSSSFGAMLYILDDNEAVIKMNDNRRPKSHNETCIKDPPSCFGLVV